MFVLLAVGAWAGHACPFLPVPGVEPFHASLLAGRMEVAFDIEGAVVRSGMDLAQGAHDVVPLEPWKQVVRWDDAHGGAILVAEEPLHDAPSDLAAPLQEAAIERFGPDFPGSATAVPLPLAAGRGAALVGPVLGDKWGISAVLALSDSSLLRVAVMLPADAEAACRDAAVQRISEVKAGKRQQDLGGYRAEVPLTLGPTLALDVPEGWALKVSIGFEFTLVAVTSWTRPAEAIELVGTVVTFEERPKPKGRRIARATILGERAVWTPVPDHADGEQAWLRGWVGKERLGYMRVMVVAATRERRAELRKIAEAASFEEPKPAP